MKVQTRWVGSSFGFVVLLLLVAAGTPTDAGQAGPAPFGLAVQVVYGDDSLGEESLRENVERWVFREIASHGCFASMERYRVDATAGEVGDGAVESDLLLRIRLTDLEVHESWDVSLAERMAPDQVGEDMSNRVTATVAFNVDMDLLVLPEQQLIRERDYRHHQTYRPTMNEDPREAVRLLVLEDLSRDARSFVCKGAKKLPRAVERARTRDAD